MVCIFDAQCRASSSGSEPLALCDQSILRRIERRMSRVCAVYIPATEKEAQNYFLHCDNEKWRGNVINTFHYVNKPQMRKAQLVVFVLPAS